MEKPKNGCAPDPVEDAVEHLRRIGRVLLVVLALGVGTFLGGCRDGGDGEVAEQVPPASISAAGSWTLASIDDRDVQADPPLAIKLSPDGTLLASDACNTITGEWSDAADSRVELRKVVRTLKICVGANDILPMPWTSAYVNASGMLVVASDRAEMTWRRD